MKFVLAIPAVFGLLAAAAPSDPIASQCKTGTPKCCETVGAANSNPVSALLGLHGIVLGDATAIVGLNCTPIAVGGAGKNANGVGKDVNSVGKDANSVVKDANSVVKERIALEKMRIALDNMGMPSEEIPIASERIRIASERMRIASEKMRMVPERIRIASEKMRMGGKTRMASEKARTAPNSPYAARTYSLMVLSTLAAHPFPSKNIVG